MPKDRDSWPAVRASVVRDAVGIGVATGAYALSFGAIAQAAGFSVAQACVLSLAMFTGASQFALVGVVGTGGAASAGVATATLLGTRNALYGIRLAPLLRQRGLGRLRAAHLVIDESTAMATARDDPRAGRLGFWATGLAVFVCWNLGTVAGAAGASVLADPRSLGLDAAAPAAFPCAGRAAGRDARDGDRGSARRAGRNHLDSGRGRGRPRPGGGSGRGRCGISRRGARALMWPAVLVASAGRYLLKLAGMSLPAARARRRPVRRIGALLPVALLSALVATQTFATGHALTVDARTAGLAVAAGAVVARAPFLVVIVAASAATALVRAVS